jgi:hypothetical protein
MQGVDDFEGVSHGLCSWAEGKLTNRAARLQVMLQP